MTTFDDRERAFENKYAHDAEMQFKAQARRNRLLGLWVAGQFGLSGDAANEYAKSVVIADLQEAGDDDVVRKVLADFEARGLDFSEHQIRTKIKELTVEAKTQVLSEAGG